ncbi:MAG: FecR domain-containing protein [Verrucomicrobia bacterium]|nr:FecR domain-containing protein [Verrucomicrobiota bacterium]
MNTLFSQGKLGKCAIIVAVIAMWSFCGSTIHAKPLGNATVTLVNNDVRYKPGAGDERAAKPKDVVKGADTVRTGQKSQAELEFEDRTITRLGSNSTFTFDPDKREFQLKKGLLLFDMPKGAGGGKIITPAGTAAIEGTAGIVSYRSAPKIICLAGVINVLNPNGQLLAQVMPGQLFIVGVTKYPVNFMLNGIKTGKLMKGGLPNNTKEFDNSNSDQLQQIQSGQLQATPFVMMGGDTDIFIAPPTTTDSQYPQTPEIDPDKPPTPPTPTTFAITSDTTINAGTGVISGTGTLQGTVQGGKATFDFGSMNVTVTGSPSGVPAADGMFNADFNTQGTVSFNNLVEGSNIGGPTCNGVNLTFNAASINVANSNFEIGGDGDSGPSSMSFFASGTQNGNVIVDPSTLRVRSGVADGSSYTAGLIHLESANGYVAFVGDGYDPINDPDDLLRSHAQATINIGEGVYNGGTVEFVSNGTHSYDMVSIHDATIDVAAKDSNGYLTSGNGGSVLLNGKMLVLVEETVDIDATGATPGTVRLQSSGTASQVGSIQLMIGDPTGHITIDAQPAGEYALYAGTLYGDGGSSANFININGWDNDGTKNILFNSTGPLGGGNIILSTTGDISVNNAVFDISSTSYDGGSLTMGYYSGGLYPAASLTVSSTEVDASGATTGTGGTVQFAANNVSVTGSGWTGGRTLIQAGGANGGIVSLYSTGEESGDMVYLHNVGIDAASYDAQVVVPSDNTENIQFQSEHPESQGGQVNIQGTSLVRMEGTTMIQASGPVPGTISVTAAGTSSDPGYISLDAGSGFIGLLASTFRVEDNASLSTMLGEIGIEGNTLAGGTTKTIQFSAPGGAILFSAQNRISIHGANLDVSGSGSQDGGFMMFGYTSAGGYDISELTHEIKVRNSTLLANATTGAGGGITMLADADSPDFLTDQGIHFGPNADVQANGGGGAGTITLAVEGGTTRAAAIGFNTERHSDAGILLQEGYVRLTALNSSSVGSAPTAGSILIQGTSIDGDKSINITAGNDLGGRINFNAKNSITIMDAMLGVESYPSESESESWVRLGYYNELTDVGLPTGRISLTDTIITGNGSGVQGANVSLEAYERVDLFGGTEIQANSDTTPGNVTIQVFGTASTPGVIALNVLNSTDHIKIEAQSESSDINGGEISLLGYLDGGDNINLQASGAAGGGQINLRSFGGYYAPSSWATTYLGLAGIHIQGARLDASAPSDTAVPAGQITLQAPYVGLDTAWLSAGSSFSHGNDTVGRIEVSGVNPNGTHLGTEVNIASSRLTVGGTTVADGGILITGDTVAIDLASMADLDPGPAQVHIQSRENTGNWSTTTTDPIYWTPLYFIINSSTTIDASGESVPTIVGPGGSLNGTIIDNVAVFNFGAQNVLMWPGSPDTIDNNGLFAAEFDTTGSFEALNMQNSGSGSGGPQTARVTIRAAGIQIINSIFAMGDPLADKGPSQFFLYSSTDAIAISPYDSENPTATASIFVPRSGMVGGQEMGATFHLESAGVTTLFGGDTTERTTEVLVGAAYQGGTVEIVSTGDGSGPGGSAEGVHIRNASIDVSHAILNTEGGHQKSSTAAQVGGNVTVDGKKQVTIRDTTDIYADGTTAGSIQVISEGTASTAGQVVVNNESSTGYIRLSAQDSATVLGALTSGGDINIVGAPRSSGSENVQITAGGPMGGGNITITAVQNLNIINAQLNGGNIALTANNVNINRSLLSAGSVSGPAGRIFITGYSSASVLNSILQILGTTAGSGSGIYISSPTVNLAGTALKPGPTGSAQIYANTLVNPPASGSYVLNPYTGSGAP